MTSDSLDTYTSPVIAGHRGFKGEYPENTLTGFNKCYETGATVIETDLWLTLDEVIVISHDPNTKRVFVDSEGNETDYNIPKTSYEEVLKYLKTKEGGEPLLTFREVLQWFVDYVSESRSNIHKLMLDIKRLNPAKVLKFIIGDLLAVNNDISWWFHRIQLGVWDLNVVKYMNQDEFFQSLVKNSHGKNPLGWVWFDVFHISVSWRDSIHYINYNFYLDTLKDEDSKTGIVRFKVTGISLLYFLTWSTGFLTKFLPLLRIQRLKLYSWTINTAVQYDFLSKVGKVADLPEYGVISDYPDQMVKHKEDEERKEEFEKNSVDELSRLTPSSTDYYDEDGNLSVKLTFRMKFGNYFYESFQALAGSKRITDEEKQFDLEVDENKVAVVKVSQLFIWVFSTCQKLGIF